MKTVACVYRTGGVYDWSWVEKLQRGVARHLREPHRFVCLTDDLPGPALPVIRRRPLVHGWPGWWSKLELFRELFDGPILYIDLDSIIADDLAPLFTPRGFRMVPDYLSRERGRNNSSVMAWAGDYSAIYHAFAADPAKAMEFYSRTQDGRIGDQAFIEDALADMGREIGHFTPGAVVSFKKHIRSRRRSGPPDGCRVVQFHGAPKMHECDEEWVMREWR